MSFFLPALIVTNLLAGALAAFYIRRFHNFRQKNSQENEKRERELRRRVLELQILRSLGERAGYSLDLHKILEVITDSLSGLVNFSTVSYMTLSPTADGRIILKTRVQTGVSRLFLEQVKMQMLNAFSAMIKRNLQPNLVDETISGSTLDEQLNQTVKSFFNLPLIVGGQVVALINVSSPEPNLYGDEETAILYTVMSQVSSQADKLVQVVENEERKLSAMIASLTDGIMMVDAKFNLIVANSAVGGLLNLPRTATLYDIFASVGNKANLQAAIQQALYSQKIVKISAFEISGKAVQIDVDPVKDKYGYLLGVVVIFHNITEQKQLERLREDFTAMMVHELRTPLTTISYSTNMVLSDLPKISLDQVENTMEIINSTTANMLILVGNLLDISKMEAGKFVVIVKDEDLAQMIAQKVEAFKPLAEQKQLKLVTEMDSNLKVFPFDKVRLGQAIDNLISNAIKYTDRGIVIIKTEMKGEDVLVSVADTGEGIDQQDISKLFSKFEQLGKGRTGEKGGTGLGLVVTKGIIEAHGGKIWAQSKGSGQGATFTFSLPLKPKT